jgi:hypothetical protein
MNERLIKQWQITEVLLRDAAAEISDPQALAACEDFLSHNELELALDVLEDAGHGEKVSREFWWNLKKAAEVMGLTERYAALREQVRVASGAAQPVIPSDASRRR